LFPSNKDAGFYDITLNKHNFVERNDIELVDI